MVIVLIAALSCQSATAQAAPSATERIVHETWTFANGAPEHPVTFAQTADGFLWIGAASGLFRFDGTRFELFRSPFGDRLSSTNIQALLAADDGLWIGYLFGGFSFVKNDKVTNHVELTGTVTAFARDRDGTVWAGSVAPRGRSGLWRFDGSAWHTVEPDLGMPAEPVADLGFDRDGRLWIIVGARGSEIPKELYFLQPGERRVRKAGENLRVDYFTRDADQHVLTSPERSPGERHSRLQAALPAYPILRDDSGQLVDRANAVWLFGSPVLRRQGEEPLADLVANASPSNSDAFAMNPRDGAHLVDREGSVWIGSDSGVHRFSYSPLARVELPKEPAPWFMLVPDDNGAVWINASNGTGSSSLYHVAGTTVDAQHSLPATSSFAYRAPDKTQWFGGEDGLWHRVGDRLTKVELPAEVADVPRRLVVMTDDGAGGFWVSLGGGAFYRLQDGGWTKFKSRREMPPETARKTCPTSGVVYATTDSQRRVWLGCVRNQVAMLHADEERTFGPDDGVDVGNVTGLHARGSDVWIGGEFGLQRLDQGRFRTLHALDEEALRGISGIVQTADGDLWLNGLGGIVHLPHDEILKAIKDPAYAVSSERFDRRAGLPGLPSQLRQMPTAVEGSDGRLWFTVNSGVVWIDPTRASRTTPAPPVSIQSVFADDKLQDLGAVARFAAGTSSVRIVYAAVSLLNPEAIRFRYRLSGIDEGWREAGGATAVTYRSLAPGAYRFEVGVTDPSGRWSDRTATTGFTILPAFYQTAWFRALCLVLVLALAGTGYQLRVRQLRQRFEMTLDARVAERTRIARDLHDTLLQSFHGLLLRFQTAFNLLPDRPAESKQVLASAIDQAAEAITEGRDTVQGLRASAAETNDLADSLRALAEDLANESGNHASLHMEVQGTPRALHPIVRDEVFRIAGEALRNAFRHADATQVEVELRYDVRDLRVRVRDDGKGIDPEVLRAEGREGHFGLGGMRERAKLTGGKLTVWSGLDAGTEVELSIPGPHAYSSSSPSRSWLAQKVFGPGDTSDS
jgi:signal transduction histidine kinase/ligand-binding sensor domain-containing protein